MKLMMHLAADYRLLGRVLMWVFVLAGTPRVLPAEDAATITRKVQAGDTLLITVDEPEIGKVEKKVDADGKITFNLLGELNVKDKSTAEIEKLIHDGLDKDWIINPQVNVVVVMYVEKIVTVNGFVFRAGPVKLSPDRKMSLTEVVATAGGVNQQGNRKKVQLSRNGVVKVYNLDDLAKIKDPEKQVYVEPDDTVTVPQVKF